MTRSKARALAGTIKNSSVRAEKHGFTSFQVLKALCTHTQKGSSLLWTGRNLNQVSSLTLLRPPKHKLKDIPILSH